MTQAEVLERKPHLLSSVCTSVTASPSSCTTWDLRALLTWSSGVPRVSLLQPRVCSCSPSLVTWASSSRVQMFSAPSQWPKEVLVFSAVWSSHLQERGDHHCRDPLPPSCHSSLLKQMSWSLSAQHLLWLFGFSEEQPKVSPTIFLTPSHPPHSTRPSQWTPQTLHHAPEPVPAVPSWTVLMPFTPLNRIASMSPCTYPVFTLPSFPP